MNYHSPPKRQNSPKVNITFSYVSTPQHQNKENHQPPNTMLQPVAQFTGANHKVCLKDVKFKCIKCGKTVNDENFNQSQPKCKKCKHKSTMTDRINFSKTPKNKLSPEDRNKQTIQNYKTKGITCRSKEFQLQYFLREVQKQYISTTGKLKEVRKQQETLKQIFDDKRAYLKNHYEKIQNAIQEAMIKDIQALKESENQQLNLIKEQQEILIKDLEKLQGIRQDIQPNIQKIIQKVQDQRYNDFLSKYKKEVNRIASINLSRISSKHTFTASIQDKQSFYDSSLFRIIEGTHQHIHSRSESFVMAANSGIFFSFQKKKI